jgi:hypothetical protein
MQQPHIPFWFKQRQGKAEPAGDETLRLTAPNMPDAFVGIRKGSNGQWRPLLRQNADGPDLVPADLAFNTPEEAWDAAFEFHRENFVV